jgi:phosphoribosylaminoimidazole (AIR) synthetase
MGIGMVFVVNDEDVSIISDILKDFSPVYEIGKVVAGDGRVTIS